MWQGWINVFAGAWLILCGFIPALRSPVSMFAAGAVIFVDGILGTIENRSWQSGLNAAAGAWLFLSGIWFGLYVPWNFLVFGVFVLLLAGWNLSQHPNPTHATAQ
jgi:hypothetical protein